MSEAEEDADRRPIARLRRLVAALAIFDTPHPADAGWFIACCKRYEAACRAGLSIDLDAALGLTGAGRQTWWNEELRRRRDTLLRELHTRHFADLTAGQAAGIIARLAQEVQQAGIPALRRVTIMHGLIAEAIMTGQTIPGPKQLTRILDIKP